MGSKSVSTDCSGKRFPGCSLRKTSRSCLVKGVIDAGQGRMSEPFQQLVLKEQPFAVLRTWVEHFFQRKYPLFVLLLTHQVDCAESSLTEQLLHTIIAFVIVLHRNANRKRHLFLQHRYLFS